MISLEQQADLEKLTAGLGKRFGHGSSIFIQIPHYNPIKLFTATVGGHKDTIGSPDGTHDAAGSAIEVEKAVLAALGENYERHSLSQPFPSTATKTFSYDTRPADINCIAFDELLEIQGMQDSQFDLPMNPCQRIQNNTVFRWIPCRRLLTNDEVWIPETAVSLKINGTRYFDVTTNGCAIAKSTDQAILSAALELIERDNFMSFWWQRGEPVFVDFRKMLMKCEPALMNAFGPWINLVELIYFPGELGIPTFFSVFRSENHRQHPAFLVAAASHLDPLIAAKKALLELGLIMNFRMKFFETKIAPTPKANLSFESDFDSLDSRALHYLFDDFAANIFFSQTQKRKEHRIHLTEIRSLKKTTTSEGLIEIKTRFHTSGFNPIVVDQTSSDVRALGYHVARVLDSKMIDIDSAHSTRRWGKQRLYGGGINSAADLNQFPHPFP